MNSKLQKVRNLHLHDIGVIRLILDSWLNRIIIAVLKNDNPQEQNKMLDIIFVGVTNIKGSLLEISNLDLEITDCELQVKDNKYYTEIIFLTGFGSLEWKLSFEFMDVEIRQFSNQFQYDN